MTVWTNRVPERKRAKNTPNPAPKADGREGAAAAARAALPRCAAARFPAAAPLSHARRTKQGAPQRAAVTGGGGAAEGVRGAEARVVWNIEQCGCAHFPPNLV